MRFFYDCEFIEDGTTIDLISIGIVDETVREYYAVASDAPWKRIRRSDWLVEHVLPHLPGGYVSPGLGFAPAKWRVDKTDTRVKPKWVIANEVRDYLTACDEPVELWADYGAYDHVVLAQLYGPMIHLPAGLPMCTFDIQQEAQRLGAAGSLPQPTANAHDALADARMVRTCWEWLAQIDRDGHALATGGVYTGGPHLLVGETGPEIL